MLSLRAATGAFVASSLSRGLLFGFSFAILILTWYAMFVFVTLRLGGTLVPWEMWGAQLPASGSWEQTVNDLFRSTAVRSVCATIAISPSVVAFCFAVRQQTSRFARQWLPAAFAITNIGFIILLIATVPLANWFADIWLPQPRPQIDVGYHRTWLGFVFLCVLLTLLYIVQIKLGRQFRRLKDEQLRLLTKRHSSSGF